VICYNRIRKRSENETKERPKENKEKVGSAAIN